MGKKYTTDEIEVGGHMLDASMMTSLNTVVTDSPNYMTTLPSHTHPYLPLTGGSLTGPLSISGNASYLGNWGYDTLTLKDGGYPGINFRSGNTSILQRMRSGTVEMQWAYSTNASATGVGGYTEGMKLSGNSLTAYGDMRAPLFYDSNNTVYYVNPANTSRFRALELGVSNTTDQGTLLIHGYIANKTSKIMTTDGNLHIDAAAGNHATYINFYTGTGGVKFGNGATGTNAEVSSSGILYANQARASWFYDKDNTTYYTNPAGISKLYQLRVDEGDGGMNSNFLFGQAGSQEHRLFGAANHQYNLIGSSSPYFKWGQSVTDGNHNIKMTLSNSGLNVVGVLTATGGTSTEWNTAYTHSQAAHAPSNAEANVYSTPTELLTAIKTVDGSGSGLDADKLDGLNSGQSGANVVLRTASNGYLYVNNWIHPANSTGLFYDAGVHFYEVSNYMYSSTSLQAANDMRAPIFYDRDNTGYYLNPAGTSRLGYAHFDGYSDTSGNARTTTGVSLGRYTSEFAHIDIASSHGSGGWIDFTDASGEDFGGRIRYRNSSEYMSFYSGGSNEEFRIHSSYTVSLGSSRAPVFYDLDNTGYYVNPASTSNLNGLNVNGTISGTTSGNWSHSGINAGRNIVLGTDLDTDLDSGGTFSSYGSSNTSWNAPQSYGGVVGYAFSSGIKGQQFFDIRHNNSDYSDYWFRSKNNLGFTPWAKVWHNLNDGAGSGLDADTVDGVQGGSFIRSDENDDFSGVLTGTSSGENLKIGGIRGTAKGSQTGQYIHLYERVHIGGPSGWGAGNHGAPGSGLSTWGSANFGMSGGGVIQLNGTTVVDVDRNGIFNNVQIAASIQHAGDTNTWFGFDMGSDIFRVVTNGTERYRVDNDGTGFYGAIGLKNTSSTSKHGIDLYGGAKPNGQPEYGMMFTGTYASGTSGDVTGDWATYFTMNGGADRGWIFKGAQGNTSSISSGGVATFNSAIKSPVFYDSNNTGYYVNPAGTSNLNTVNALSLNVSGNTTLGNGNGDVTHINDVLHIGATDSGNADLFFGEGSTNSINYGAHFNWDSGYRFTWSTRNAGVDTKLFHYDTNNTSYLVWGRNLHMDNKSIDYVSQLHFYDNVRFYDDGNNNYLNFKYGNAGGGGIKIRNGASEIKGYIYASTNEFGLLDNDGNWAVRTQTGTNPLELRCDNNVEFQVYNSYTLSPGSSRAPIFYDSDSTSYYVNPSSTTSINVAGQIRGASVRVTNIITNKIVKFDGSVLSNSIMSDNGSTISVSGNVEHNGLTMTEGTDVDQVKTFALSLTPTTTDWMDTGINYNDLANGTYSVQCHINNSTHGSYDVRYSGMMSWFGSGSTNDTSADEIHMHRAGHAPNQEFSFRTLHQYSSVGTHLKFQIKSSAIESTAATYTFKFRRLI